MFLQNKEFYTILESFINHKNSFIAFINYEASVLRIDKNSTVPIISEQPSYISLDKISYQARPPWGPGGISRECVLRIPSVIVKGD